MAKLIKVSFELTDNWNIKGFRNFIKLLLSDPKYDVYIISNSDSSNYINGVGATLSMDNSNIIITNFTNDKLQAIVDNNIDIHLDNLQTFTMLVDETTDANGILVTPNLNKFYLTPDYVLVFNSIVKLLEKNDTETC